MFVVVPLVIIGGLIYWLGWSGSTDDIKSVASQLKVPSDWKLVQSNADPPRTICIAQKCPHLQRTWVVSGVITQEGISNLLRDSGWSQVVVEDLCSNRNKVEGSDDLCRMYGPVDGYDVTIVPPSSNPLDTQTVSLYIE